MATENVRFLTTIQAGEDLNTSGHQYQAIALNDGKVANNGAEAGGILLSKPKSEDFLTLGREGEMKFRAGEAIQIAKPLTVVTSGYFTVAGSGDYIVGRAKSAVTSGSIGPGFFDFTAPVYAFSSSFAW